MKSRTTMQGSREAAISDSTQDQGKQTARKTMLGDMMCSVMGAHKMLPQYLNTWLRVKAYEGEAAERSQE